MSVDSPEKLNELHIVNEFKNKNNLAHLMAVICHCAQENVIGWELNDELTLDNLFVNTSYQIACLLAHNTINGRKGVESDVVLEELCGKCLTVADWNDMLLDIVDYLGGWN